MPCKCFGLAVIFAYMSEKEAKCMSVCVSEQLLSQWSEAYRNSPERQMATMALSRSDLNSVDVVPNQAAKMRHKFSLNLETLPVTNQKQSGRCWLFAATNVLRESIAQKLNLKDFELSQSYLAFWDKFERANYFLDLMIRHADVPANDRTVSFILATGVHDGGQWDMFANIVRKYGVVPKDVYDETYQSSSTRAMNHVLNRSLKAGTARLRAMKKAGASQDELESVQKEIMGKVYGFLCSCYGGEPPCCFDFEYVDKDGAYHEEKGMTPRTFADKYASETLNESVSIIHAPTADKPWHEMFTVKYLGNVVGMDQVKHLNLPLDEMKAAIIRQMQDGKVVWFGSDVGKFGDRDNGYWDDTSFQAELLTGLDLAISKEDSLDLGFAAMNHAMVLTGVHLEDGRPVRWRIENSWGDEKGKKGYYICSDTWFDQYVFQAAVEKKYLLDNAQYLTRTPVELEPWDPMGTLAE